MHPNDTVSENDNVADFDYECFYDDLGYLVIVIVMGGAHERQSLSDVVAELGAYATAELFQATPP